MVSADAGAPTLRDTKEPKSTWYSLHKEQVRLVQYLLYHLKKDKKKKQLVVKETTNEDSFTVSFT
jgi:hypothetical protein